MTEPADREVRFTHIRVLEDGTTVAPCTLCGALVDDTDTHVCDPVSAEDSPEQDY